MGGLVTTPKSSSVHRLSLMWFYREMCRAGPSSPWSHVRSFICSFYLRIVLSIPKATENKSKAFYLTKKEHSSTQRVNAGGRGGKIGLPKCYNCRTKIDGTPPPKCLMSTWDLYLLQVFSWIIRDLTPKLLVDPMICISHQPPGDGRREPRHQFLGSSAGLLLTLWPWAYHFPTVSLIPTPQN